MKYSIYVISFILVLISFYSIQEGDKDVKHDKDVKKLEEKSITKSNNEIHVVFKNKNSDKKINKIKKEEKKDEVNRPKADIEKGNIDEDLQRLVDSGYIAASERVGDYTIDMVTEQKFDRNDDLPPSIPLVVNGTVDGKSFSVSVKREEVQSGFYMVVRNSDNKIVKLKELPPELVQQSSIIDIEQTTSVNDSENSSQQEHLSAPPIPPSF